MVFIVTAFRNLFYFLFGRIYSEYVYLFGIGRRYKEEKDSERAAAYIHQLIENLTENRRCQLDPFLLNRCGMNFKTLLGFLKVSGKIKFCRGSISGFRTLKQADFCSLTSMDGLMRVNASLRAGPLGFSSWLIVSLFGFKHEFFIKGTLNHVKFLCDFIVNSKTRTKGAFNYLFIREVDGMKLWIQEGLGLLKWPVNLAILLSVNFLKPFIRNAVEYLLEYRIKNEFPNYEFPVEGNLKEISSDKSCDGQVSDSPQITKPKASKVHFTDYLGSASSALKKEPPVGFKDNTSNSESKAEEVNYKPIVIGGKTFNLSMMYIRISMAKNSLKLRRISETEYKAKNAGNTETNEYKNEPNYRSVTASHTNNISDFQSAMEELQLHGYTGTEFKKYYDDASTLADDLRQSSDTLIYVGSLLCLVLIESYMRDERTGDLLDEVELSGDRRIQFIRQYNEIGKLVEEIKLSSNALKQVGSLFCRIAMERYMADAPLIALGGSGHKATFKGMELAENLPGTSVGRMTEKLEESQDNQTLRTGETSLDNPLGPNLLKDTRRLKDSDFSNPLTVTEKSTTNKNIDLELEKRFTEIVSNTDSSTVLMNATDKEIGAGKEVSCESEPTFVDTNIKVASEKVPVVEKTRNLAAACKVTTPESFEDKESNILGINQDKALIEAMENLDQILNGNKVLLLKALKVLEDLNISLLKPAQENPLLVRHKLKYQTFAALQQDAVEEFVKSGGDCERISDVNKLKSCVQFSDCVDEAIEKRQGIEGTGGQNISKNCNQSVNSGDGFVDLLFYSSMMPKCEKGSTAEQDMNIEAKVAEEKIPIDKMENSAASCKVKVATKSDKVEEILQSEAVTTTASELEAELVNGDSHRNIHQHAPFRLNSEDFAQSQEIITHKPLDRKELPSTNQENIPERKKHQENYNNELETALGVESICKNLQCKAEINHTNEIPELSVPSDEICAESNLPSETEMTITCEPEVSCKEEYVHAKLPTEAKVKTMTATNGTVDVTTERDSEEKLSLEVNGVSYKEESDLGELSFEAKIEPITATNASADVTAGGDAKEKLLQVETGATCDAGKDNTKENCSLKRRSM